MSCELCLDEHKAERKQQSHHRGSCLFSNCRLRKQGFLPVTPMAPQTTAKMDLANRALCYAYRNPVKGVKKTPLKTIITHKLVRKTDGSVPSEGAISKAAKDFMEEKEQRGRPTGTRNTTKAEDRVIMQKFRELRPPGAYIDSRILHDNLPRKIARKITRRTVLSRLEDMGYTPQTKLGKTDLGPKQCAARWKWCKKFEGRAPAQWKTKLQACGDIKLFTFYPKGMRSKFKRLRSSWTIMSDAERRLPAFQRPKKWFNKEEWKKVRQQKLFAMTTSKGEIFTILIPSPFDKFVWAEMVKQKLGPWLKERFPRHQEIVILLDGEKIFRAPVVKKVYKEFNITLLPGWPANSPELNPQENVWPWAENYLRNYLEDDKKDTFEYFQKNIQWAVQAYPSADKLIPSMAKRVTKCIESKGNMIDQ